ncbi:MAG: hypothetical protein QW572_07210 [Candidatus Nitrosocaldus sp.]
MSIELIAVIIILVMVAIGSTYEAYFLSRRGNKKRDKNGKEN